jgi:hypothetical protein
VLAFLRSHPLKVPLSDKFRADRLEFRNLSDWLVASVTGEFIDMACYFDDGASGPGHAECARMCIASGLPVGLKGRDGKIYVLIGNQVPPGSKPAAKHESLKA